MATQQGMGLFGMPTAQEARQQYEQGLMLTPAQMGSQGLLQQVVSTIGQGGGMAGYGLGRMMGGRTAQEAEAMGMEQAMQEVTAMGITDPSKRMTALADALQKRGLSRAAMQALEKGRAMKLQDLQTQQAESGLMTLKPIKGAMRVVGQDSLGNPVYKQDIIGYQQGSRFMTPAQAEAYIKGLSPADAAAATGTPETVGDIRKRLMSSLTDDEKRMQERNVAAAGDVARSQGLYDQASGFEDPAYLRTGEKALPKTVIEKFVGEETDAYGQSLRGVRTPVEEMTRIADIKGTGIQGTSIPVREGKVTGTELPKTGLVQNARITQNLTSQGRAVFQRERARKLPELATRLAAATNDTERARILREARRLGISYKELTSGK